MGLKLNFLLINKYRFRSSHFLVSFAWCLVYDTYFSSLRSSDMIHTLHLLSDLFNPKSRGYNLMTWKEEGFEQKTERIEREWENEAGREKEAQSWDGWEKRHFTTVRPHDTSTRYQEFSFLEFPGFSSLFLAHFSVLIYIFFI